MYTYTLNGTTVNPLGEWEIEYRRNAGQIFWRRHLTGELIFKDEDYQAIINIAEGYVSVIDCFVLDFIIYCFDEEYWRGQFKYPYDFKFDSDSCIVTGTPEVVDEYTCIMTNYETKYRLDMALGGVLVDLRDCLGNLLIALPNAYRLGASTASGNTSYLDQLINDITRMNCGLTLSSSFMWRSDFPNGDNYAAAYGTNNYVTGAANRLEYVFLFKNTTLRNAFGGTFCDGDDWFSFKDFEDLLRNAFGAYWYIDQNGDFRIEHVSFFLSTFPHSDFADGVDLTTLISNNRRSYAYRRNKYKYLTDQLFDREVWKWQHYQGTEGTIAHGLDFEGEPVYYGDSVNEKSDCVPGEFKEKEFNSQYFWSDIFWAFQLTAAGTADTIKCPGWCMIDIVLPGTTNDVRCEQGALTGVNVINGHLSTANLQAAYHTWDRIFLTGHMNNSATPPAVEITDFDSAIKKVLQESIEFPICCDEELDPLDFIVTEMGSGTLYSAIVNKRSLKVELLYD